MNEDAAAAKKTASAHKLFVHASSEKKAACAKDAQQVAVVSQGGFPTVRYWKKATARFGARFWIVEEVNSKMLLVGITLDLAASTRSSLFKREMN